MKYQDFSSDENLLSSEDTICILHMGRYLGYYGYFSLIQQEKSITASRHQCLYNKQNITCRRVDTNLSSSVQLDIPRVNAAKASETSSWTLKDEISIRARACNILYIISFSPNNSCWSIVLKCQP